MITRNQSGSKRDVLALARLAGLDNAVDQFPADVLTAANSAEDARNSMSVIDDVASEPWPPMRVRKTL